MHLLIKKQLFDIKKKILLYLALFFIILVGMIFYSGFNGAKNNILGSISDFYINNNLADYTIETPTSFNDDELNSFLNELDGTYDLVYKQSDTAKNAFYYRNTFNINKYSLVKGYINDGIHNIILDYDYATTNGYDINQYIIINNKAYYITGLAKFPNHIFKGNYFPDKSSTYIALKIVDELPTVNTIYIDSDIDETKLTELVNTYFNDPNIRITYMTDDYGYQRIEGDLALVNSILFIFPLACFISIIIILFINYNRIIDEQKPYIGILKANGYGIKRIYISLLIFPLILVLFSATIGSIIGINTIPKFYIKIIGNYYAIPTITNFSIFYNVILPIIILLITTILTISIPILLTINKDPIYLLKTEAESKFGRTFLRNIKLPYHLKLIIRNIITSKRKNICLTIASSLLLGIVLAVFYVSDSLNYTDSTLARETFNGDFVLSVNADKDLSEIDNAIEDKYFYYSMSIRTSIRQTNESLIVFDSCKPCINIKDENNNILDPTLDGIYLPSSYKDFNLKVGDKITIYLASNNYTKGIEFNIAAFMQEMGTLKFAISLNSIKNANLELYNKLIPLKENLPSLVKLNSSYDTSKLKDLIANTYDPTIVINKVEMGSGLLTISNNLYTSNQNLNEINNLDLKKYGFVESYEAYSGTLILMNDDLDILNLKIMPSEIMPNLGKEGIYLPIKYKDIIKDKITYYLNKNYYEANIAGYVEGNIAYMHLDYAKIINHPYEQNVTKYYLFQDNHNIDELKNDLIETIPYSDYSTNDLNTFGERLGIISELLDFTKILATGLSTIIFILLVYNIGVIGLTNRLVDIRVFKSAGLKNSKLKHMLSIENVIVVLISAILSIPVGLLIANKVIDDIYEISSIKMILYQRASSVIIIMLISLILISITSFFINKKIEKLNLANLMKGDM